MTPIPGLSVADHAHSPPSIYIPQCYNAAYDLIERNLRAGRADKIAFMDDSSSCSYGELSRRVGSFANALRDGGIRRGERVLLCLQDCIDFPVCFLGAIHAGVVPVAVNTLLTSSDYHYILSDSEASVAIVSAAVAPVFVPLLNTAPSLRQILIAGNADAQQGSLHRFVAGASPEARVAATRRDEVCFWLYSSGSTGRPKGTVHVQSSLIYTAELYARGILGIRETDVVLSAAKLFFAYGLGNALTFPLSVGATAVLMAERATPAAVFARLTRHRATIFGGVPTLYAAMLASPELAASDLTHLRRCTSAGEPLPEDLGRRWSRALGIDILDGIGSTEMLHIFLSNTPANVRYGSTGRPVPGYCVRLVDEQGAEVADGEHGELHIQGPSSATMYWNNRKKTDSTFVGGWTRSGDKYLRTPDGYYIYAGRSDDMLKVSGIYVSPAEVEAAMITHPAVLEVAVVGREDKDELIKPSAYVVLKSGVGACDALAQELKLHIKSLLAPYKYPRWVEFVDELPKTATGKIQRYKLRAPQTRDDAAR